MLSSYFMELPHGVIPEWQLPAQSPAS